MWGEGSRDSGGTARAQRVLAGASVLAALVLAVSPAAVTPARAESEDCAEARALRLLRLPAYRELAARCAAEAAGETRASGGAMTARGGIGGNDGAKSAGEAPATLSDSDPDEAYARTSKRRARAIYGRDDRIEAEQVSGLLHPRTPAIQRAVRATAALVRSDKLDRAGSGWRLRLEPHLVWTGSASRPLCPDERFARQRKGAHCTVFFVSPTVMLTAGHCITFKDVEPDEPSRGRYRVVFGFETRGTAERTSFKADEVYDIARVIESRNDKSGPPDMARDYAVIELDRPVAATVAEPLRLASAFPALAIDVDTPLGVIGHPSGLSKKVSFGVDEAAIGRAREPGNGVRFRASLNTFHGNSGSPVLFYDAPDVVAGILVAGEEDYLEDPSRGCVRTAIYADGQQCKQPNGVKEPCAEKVTKISAVAPFIPDP